MFLLHVALAAALCRVGEKLRTGDVDAYRTRKQIGPTVGVATL